MLLYLLRHGDAIESSQFHDSERPLSEFGQNQATTVGSFVLSNKISFGRILSSPLVRSVQTATIVGKIVHGSDVEQTEFLIPGTRKTQLFDLLNSTTPESVLLVGHEPHLGQLVSLLLTGREDMPFEFKKCSLACLLASSPVRKGHAVLEWFIPYRQMELLRR